MVDREMQEAKIHVDGQGIATEEGMMSRRALIKVGWSIPVVAMVMTPSSVFAEASPGPDSECPRSYGYWSCNGNVKHEWSLTDLNIGGITYDQATAMQIMDAKYPGGKVQVDNRIQMFRQLAAAQLNIAHGSDGSSIQSAITAAQTWMTNHQIVGTKSTSDEWWLEANGEGWNPVQNWDPGIENVKNLLETFNTQPCS